jgi:PAS domain S-box-containing protein
MRELFPEAEDMWLNDYAEVARTGRPKRFVDKIEELGRWFDVYVFPAEAPGRLAALFRDVTDQKRAEYALRESERRLRATQDSVGIGIQELDEFGHFLRVNPTYTRISGFSLQDLAGQSMFERISDENDRRAARERYGSLTRGEIDSYVEERQYLTKGGRPVWVEALVSAVRSDDGRFLYAVRAVHDVTQRRDAEQALRESEGRLRAAVNDRDALLKEVHHRVKNNLQVITSLLEMQARQTADQQALSSLSEARNRISAIGAIHELLYQSGSFSDVDLAIYARRLLRHLASLYDSNSRIHAAVDGDGITIDLARAIPFGLLLNEIVSNAYKHAFRSLTRGELRVSLKKEDGHMRLRVADTGVGLPPGFNDRAPATLGLQLVRMLVKQLGGTVRFESRGGTNVEVVVPILGTVV